MAQSTTDRNLLFGILALQMDFITSNALINAMNTWVSEKEKPLGQVLQSQSALVEDDDRLLDSLVRRLLEKHGNDVQWSLAAVSAATGIREVLEQIGDHELSLSAGFLANAAESTAADADNTSNRAAGAASSGGTRFRLLQFHARGGQGEVWIAEDTELHRKVALKQLQAHCADNPGSQVRFVHEAEVTGALEHRGIAPVYGLGHFDDGRPFYAMQFIGGTSLKDAIKRFHAEDPSAQNPEDRLLELRRFLSRFVDVCNTVAYAHSRGVIHRDLKPSNIILDEYGETLVVDWGLAKSGCPGVESSSGEPAHHPVSASELPSTMTDATMGTPPFMSPEQAAGRTSEVGPAADVYSLGATLYCLLTGKAPFEGSNQVLVLKKVAAGEFLRPRQAVSAVPIALEAICLKAMALAPEGRYSSARALGDDIERWLADQPVLAYAEPLPARAMRWVRRRKQWVAAAAVMLILTVLGLAVHDWRITREQGRTTDQLAMTRDALRELYKVSGENLAYIPNTEKLREYLAQLVLDRYQQLGDKFPADPGVRLETAQVYRVIGGIGRITGQYAKSHESYENAIKGLTTLCEEDQDQADYRRRLVEAFNERGELNHMNGKTIDAEKDFRAAISHAEKLPSLPTFALDHRRAMAEVLINLSEILVLKSELENAHKAADQAVELLKPHAGPDAQSDLQARERWLVSLALTDRGVASREAGDRDRASHDFDEAAQLAGSIAQDDERFDDSQFQLACIANQRGELLSKDQSKLAESEKSFEQASHILTTLIKDHKVVPHYREEMVVTLSGRAAVRLAMTRIPDAQRDCEAAVEHLAGLIGEQTRKGAPENPQYLSLLGQVLALQSRIHFLQGRAPEGRQNHAEAVKKLSRAIQLDAARAADKVRLEQMSAGPAQWEE